MAGPSGLTMKFAPGNAYGPILSSTELYLLGSKLQLHPILTHGDNKFHLVFNLASGQTGGFNPDDQNRDLPFTQKDDMATFPRVSEIYIITTLSPWCTLVRNPKGVSLGDVCGALWKDYSEIYLTETEFTTLPPTQQDRIRRTALQRETGGGPYWQGGVPQGGNNRCKRVDWLRDRLYFDGLEHEESIAQARLGFRAPNVFVLNLTQ